ncbi:hypothetical protein [Roseimarinus sediminis]|jgi:hypothetical protein|uniref:hypothetical protein n=1 Tax=Roseimarinus sediminis TaxID=1610899 RepID=UPI003D1BF3AC
MGKIETWKIYGLIILISFINIIIVNAILSDDIYVNTYSGQLSTEMIAKILAFKSKYQWINYILIPVILILKTGLIAAFLWVGSFMNNSKLEYKEYLRVVIMAELVFVFFSFIRTGGLYYYNFQTLIEIGQFQPFTLFSLLDINNIPEYVHYPLSLISIPEAIYWIVLALLLKQLISGNIWNRIGFIAKTYGIGLLIWVSIVVFITLNFTT